MLRSIRLVVMTALCLDVGGCITNRGDEVKDGGLDTPDGVVDAEAVDQAVVDDAYKTPANPTSLVIKPPPTIQTVAEWDALSKEVRQDIIDDDYHLYKNVTMSPRVRMQDLKDPAVRMLADRISAYMRSNGDMTVEDASHARVGNLDQWVQVLTLDGKTMLGATMTFLQQGCDLPDESVRTFATKADADKAGCETNAGYWSAHGSFNHDGIPLEYGDYLEWSGDEAGNP